MKKLATIAMAASVFMMPFAANAAPADGTYTGVVDVYKGISLKCNLTVDVSGGGTLADNLALSPTSILNFLCSSVSLNNQPYDVTPVPADPNSPPPPANAYRIHDVNVTTITPGDCEGYIDVLYLAGATPSIDLDGSLPASAGGGDCLINGVLTQ